MEPTNVRIVIVIHDLVRLMVDLTGCIAALEKYRPNV
jgi:hypothetical protein